MTRAPAPTRLGWRGGAFTALLFLALLLAIGISLTLGRYPVSLAEVGRVLATTPLVGAVGRYQDPAWVVVEVVRLPRILLVALCGMGLGLSGAAMQGAFRNPLMAPETAGVGPGASFGGVFAIFLGLSAWMAIAMSLAFGMAALVLTFFLAQIGGRSGSLAIVLAGLIIGTFFGAVIGVVEYMANPVTQLAQIMFWLFGSFANATWDKVRLVALVLLVAGGGLMLLRWRINLLSLGEIDARSLGVDVGLLRWATVGLVALFVAAQISASGQLSWIGLVTPHLARMLVGPNHSRLLPASALMGGLYLLVIDDIARTASAQEIPIGLLTTSIGAPVFAVLFWRLGSRGWAHD